MTVPPHRGKEIRAARARLDMCVNRVGFAVEQRPVEIRDQERRLRAHS
jgi:hypothetical protein